jgi:hypothetical protein
MRNHLDEIVEEEQKNTPVPLDSVLKRIADRAFRHGVERALFFRTHPDSVQPARAEEKCYCGAETQEPHKARCHGIRP